MAQKQSEDRGAVVIVVIDQETGRFALVLDRAKPEPHYWKFPGGGVDDEDVVPERPFDDLSASRGAAERELKEETGLTAELLHLASIKKRTHTQYAYLGLADFKNLAQFGVDGEIVKDFSLEQIRALQNFHPLHGRILDLALEKLEFKKAAA